MKNLDSAFRAGYESLSAWADLLDRINVFPVADGDTGANLRVSLAPFRNTIRDREETGRLLARGAVGNSGNLAAAFFREFCLAEDITGLAGHAALGREQAWQSLAAPRRGTMLDVFDVLTEALEESPEPLPPYPLLCRKLAGAVSASAEILPVLREAGVVDAGALGMYVFFEGVFRELSDPSSPPASILDLFADRLAVRPSLTHHSSQNYCVNVLLRAESDPATRKQLAGLGESLVMLPAEQGVKVHIHTADRNRLRRELAGLGEIDGWTEELIKEEGAAERAEPEKRRPIHIMTDAAGSLPRELARPNGITLLDSYVLTGDTARPESLCEPAAIYALMRAGGRVSTAQASVLERHQCYQSACRRFGPTLYLCVGSAFTGNVEVARRWQEENDPDNLLTVIDTGAASGRLGLMALLAARFAGRARLAGEVIGFAEGLLACCREYVFIDELKYLAAGGRVSRAGGFMGDLLHLKPVITPESGGVRKVGVVRSREGQLAFALERLDKETAAGDPLVIMLQYSDNREWLAEEVLPRVSGIRPRAEILRVPLSLTSGVHMGPGTWSVAWVPGELP